MKAFKTLFWGFLLFLLALGAGFYTVDQNIKQTAGFLMDEVLFSVSSGPDSVTFTVFNRDYTVSFPT